MSFVGRYINMDSSPDRRAALEARLAAVGQGGRYERFAAIDGRVATRSDSRLSAGELGCMLSQLACIAKAAGRETPTHIIEDDVAFTPHTTPILEQILCEALAAWGNAVLRHVRAAARDDAARAAQPVPQDRP